MNNKKLTIVKILLACFWVMFVTYVEAAGDLGTVLNQYKTSSLVFYAALQGLALSLLFKLWAIEMSWASIKWVLERKPLEDLVSHFVSASFPPLFFVLVIKKGAEWFTLILDTFAFFGTKGSGLNFDASVLDPGVILEQGIQLQNQMVTQFNDLVGTGAIAALSNILPSLLLMVVCLIILLAFALMAANVFLIWAEAYLLIGVSPVLLAFAGMRWTRDMAPKTFNSMVACGVKILVLMLLMSIISKLIPIWATEAGAWKIDDWSPLWRVAFSAAGCAFLAWKAPQIAANAISGTSSLTAGDALNIAAAAAIAAVGTAAVASGAAEKVLEGGANVGNRGLESLSNSMRGGSIEPITGSSANVPDPTGPAPSSDKGVSSSGKGNASTASVGGAGADKSIESMFSDFASKMNPEKNTSQKLQDGLRGVQSVIPNDQATVGGDAVKLKD